MSMNMEILGTDGPLTRSRRRALAGATPGETPGLLDDAAATAKHLFSDRTNNIEQVPLSNADCSPVQDWVKAAAGTDASIAFNLADQNACPLTPSLGGAFKVNSNEGKSVAASPCGALNGPTPSNTPTSASVPQPAPVLLSMAVNELQQGCKQALQQADPSLFDDQENPKSPLEEGHARAGTSHDEVDDDSTELAELLDDLDIVAQASPLAADVCDNKKKSSMTHNAPVLGGALCLTPPSADSSAFDEAREASITHDMQHSAVPFMLHDVDMCRVPAMSFREDPVPREHSWMHSAHQACSSEQPAEAGPFPDAPCLAGTPAAPTGISQAPNAASARMESPVCAGGREYQSTVDLGTAGCDDVIPTPGFFRPGSGPSQPTMGSPETPDDAPIKPFSFSKSAGSQYATPEIPIHSGMSPMTTAADSRHAQKHIPAWNRCTKLVEKAYPLVAKQIKSLTAMPGPQPSWAHTPYMLLHSICTTKGWELSVRHESAPRIGIDASVIATVNIPSLSDSGRTFTATGRNQGQLESLLLAAAGTLQGLLKNHMITGKDALSAVTQAASILRHGSVPSVIGNMLHFGTAPVPSAIPSGACMPQQKRPPRPNSTRRSAMPASSAPTPGAVPAAVSEVDATPEALSPHPGVGVRAPAELSNTPELVMINSPGVTPVTLGTKPRTRSSIAPAPVYHPPMRTGTSSVSNKSKASIGATAKPIGIKALKEHQKELERNMKRDTAALAALQKATEKLNLSTSTASFPLRGLPVPSGSHVLYNDDGCVEEQSRRRPQLRGVPCPSGSYKRFSTGENM